MKVSLLFSIVLLLSSSVHADWLRFRGPDGSGYAPEIKNTPTELSEATQAWKVVLPGRGLGCPVVVGDKIFVTAASGPDQQQLHVLCFAAASGERVWERRFWATGRTMTNKKTNVAAPSPASDGKHIYALFSSNDLICLDLDGNLRWMRGLTLDYPNASNSLGLASSPIVAGDTLIAQIENDSESFAAGFDLLTGENKWKIDRPKAANWTSPTILGTDENPIVALQSSKGILGVVPATGSEIFSIGDGAATIPSSAAVGDLLFIPSNGLTVYRASSDGGEPEKLWNESTQRPGTGSPLVIGEKVYIINNAAVLTCADTKTGERIWRTRLEGPVSSSPVAASDKYLYIFSEKGVGQIVDLTGDEGNIVSQIELGETILGTPALDDGALYVRSDGHLWKFGK